MPAARHARGEGEKSIGIAEPITIDDFAKIELRVANLLSPDSGAPPGMKMK
jgi:hypothetical protein